MIILAFMVQVPSCRSGGKSVRILCSETHACCLASVGDAQCGSGEKSPGGCCWKADGEWVGETVLVARDGLWMVLNWVARVDRKLCTFHSDLVSLVGELTENHQGLTMSFDGVPIRMLKVFYLVP